MEIKEIHSREVWEQYLATQKPASFLQSWNWGEFNAQTGHKIWRLGVYENGDLVAVALFLKVVARRGSFLFCPHGPVLAPDRFSRERSGPLGQVLRALEPARLLATLSDYLKVIAQQEHCSFIRISPLLENTDGNNRAFTDIGYREAPTHMMHPELTWVLDITPSEDQLLAGMRKTTRYSIRKAEKDGVTITTSSNPADLPKFLEVYDQTVQRQDFKPFSRKYFESEMEIFSKDNQCLLFFAHYQGKIVGAAFIVFSGDSAFYHHGATTRQFGKLTDAQLLQWNVIQEAKKRGLHFYNFWGVVPETATKHPWHGLSTFKRGFGGSEQHYVHVKDYVLSSRYWLTYVIEKARKIKRGL